MSTKHVFNSAEGLVLKSLRGAIALNPSLKLHAASKSVYVAYEAQPITQYTPRAVAVISGGGAGHEPAHAGYTGRGMLSASVSGDIFASPSAKQICHAIYLASSSGYTTSEIEQEIPCKDVLVIINNYTGDRLNFGLAIEKVLASSKMNIESVIVADDVSLLQPSSDSSADERRRLVGARGLAGNILVCKVLGAFAERGEPLARVKALGDSVVHNLASVGVGLEHCHVPGRGSGINDTIRMTEEECEIGLGLHNEPGVTRKKMEGVEEIIREMLKLIMRSRGNRGKEFYMTGAELNEQNTDVVLFVNNLGGMSQLEMGAVLNEILDQLGSIKIYPSRVYLSAYMTSLNAPGFSISLLDLLGVERMLQERSDWGSNSVNIPELLDDPTDAFAWIGVRHYWPLKKQVEDTSLVERDFTSTLLTKLTADSQVVPHPKHLPTEAQEILKRSIRSACRSALHAEKDLTEFDTIMGDGDCGITFSSGARAIIAYLDDGKADADMRCMTINDFVGKLGDILEDTMGGTIGALFAIFFTALSAALRDINQLPTSLDWGYALDAGVKALNKHTPAQPGDRTLIDALYPFCSALSNGLSLKQAVQTAKEGAEGTRSMQAVLGRAAYVNVSEILYGEGSPPPDPGAWGVAAIVEGLCHGLLDINE